MATKSTAPRPCPTPRCKGVLYAGDIVCYVCKIRAWLEFGYIPGACPELEEKAAIARARAEARTPDKTACKPVYKARCARCNTNLTGCRRSPIHSLCWHCYKQSEDIANVM